MQRPFPTEVEGDNRGCASVGTLTVGVFEHLVAHWLGRDILEDTGDRECCYFEVDGVAYPGGGISSWQQDKLSQQALGKWEQRDGDQVPQDHRMGTAGNPCLGFPAWLLLVALPPGMQKCPWGSCTFI